MNIEISFGCQILQQTGVIKAVIESMFESSRSFVMRQEKCGCGGHQVVYQKIRMIATGSSRKQNVYGLKLWAREDVVTPSILSIICFNVVFCEVGQDVDVSDSKNTIIVKEIDELSDIFGMNLVEIERRCKVEYLMRISHRKYQVQKSKEKVRQLGEILINKRNNQEMRQFIKFLMFERRMRQRCLKRYLTVWLISYYEGSLSTLNKEVVQQNYFTKQSDRILQLKCFNSWKKIIVR